MIGEKFGTYTITGELGRGGRGIVYEAQSEDNVKIALKTLSPKIADDETYLKRFMREAKISKSLKHPNIVNTYQYGIQNETYFISMEYVKGTDLAEILKKRGSRRLKKMSVSRRPWRRIIKVRQIRN